MNLKNNASFPAILWWATVAWLALVIVAPWMSRLQRPLKRLATYNNVEEYCNVEITTLKHGEKQKDYFKNPLKCL
jgi:hypothetical protein